MKARRKKKHRPQPLEILFQIQAGRCFYCECPLYRKRERPGARAANLDHVWPVSRGGRKPNNLVWACVTCNARKAGREPTEEELARTRELYELLDAVLYGPHISAPV